MSNFRNRAAVPLGILFAIVYLVLVYVLEGPLFIMMGPLQSLVYTSYLGLIIPHQEFAVAWLLATIDRLMSYSVPLSLPLWIILLLISSIAIRKTTKTLQLVSTTLVFLDGTWLLFAVKYLPLAGIDLVFLLHFTIWRLVLPSFLTLISAWGFTIPYWLWQRNQITESSSPRAIRFECMNCGAVFQSNPAICANCGAEHTIQEKN